MGNVLHFSCDFGDGMTCTMKVDVKKLRKRSSGAQISTWTKKPTAAVLPDYHKWMHTVNCKIADAINGNHLYGVKIPNGQMEFWMYRPGGKYEKVAGASQALTAIARDPDVVVEVSLDSDAKLLLSELGIADRFTQEGHLPGETLQVMAFDGHPTHHIVVTFFHGFPLSKDNGFVVHLLPRSKFPDPRAGHVVVKNLRETREAQGVRVIVHQ